MEINFKASTINLIESEIRPEIILRYYKGWTVTFNTKMETFSSPILCLFGFSNVKDLEIAIERSIKLRNGINLDINI